MAASRIIIYAITRSVAWTIVGVLASGVVLNAIGQVFVQPIRAVKGVKRDADHHR